MEITIKVRVDFNGEAIGDCAHEILHSREPIELTIENPDNPNHMLVLTGYLMQIELQQEEYERLKMRGEYVPCKF